MHTKHFSLLLWSFLLSASLPLLAYEFQPLGFESVGMGGAGVASARGPMAGYYNPALLTKSPHTFESNIGLGVGIRENNLVENVDQLVDLDLSGTIARLSDQLDLSNANSFAGITEQDRLNISKFSAILTKLHDNDNSLSVAPSVAIGAQLKNFSIGVFSANDAVSQAVIAPGNTELIFSNQQTYNAESYTVYYAYNPGNDSASQSYTYNIFDAAGNQIAHESIPGFTEPTDVTQDASLTQEKYEQQSLQYALQGDKTTYIMLNGISLTEVPISYARQFAVPTGALSVGASAKFMHGMTYSKIIDIDTESDQLANEFDDDYETSAAIGVDCGLLYQPSICSNLSIGLIGKNLNSPSFKTAPPAAKDYTVDPMYRLGVAYSLFNNKLDFAADYDISENSVASGEGSQFIGGGVNIHPTSWLSLRAGAMQNLANEDEGAILTGGFGIGLKWVQFDVSAEASTKTGMYDGNEIPSYTRINAAFVSRW